VPRASRFAPSGIAAADRVSSVVDSPDTCGNWSCAGQYPQSPLCQNPKYGNGDGCYQCCATNWMLSRALKYFLASPASKQMEWAMCVEPPTAWHEMPSL
jgi:hypothetical protein